MRSMGTKRPAESAAAESATAESAARPSPPPAGRRTKPRPWDEPAPEDKSPMRSLVS